MRHQGIGTFEISWPRARPFNIKTSFVVGQSFSKVSVINVRSRAPCPKLSLRQFAEFVAFTG